MSLALTRLLQLASPALPVGAYTYSQGLEWAVEAGTVKDESTVLAWIADLLEWNQGRFETPLLASMLAACRAGEYLAVRNEYFLASRETAELRAETVQMGYSMLRLLGELNDFPKAALAPLHDIEQPAFPTVWACAAVAWDIADDAALTAYLWSWAENQTMAALKSVPLGQAAGQRLLLALGSRIPAVVERALALDAADFSNFAPGFAIACSRHETQYSRLFRS
ncbi:MAG: urease accessory protein UreF [Betaproteobacteria bacterium]|nr:urease accessory protein UreF [Betaproteobacteria bacterium]